MQVEGNSEGKSNKEKTPGGFGLHPHTHWFLGSSSMPHSMWHWDAVGNRSDLVLPLAQLTGPCQGSGHWLKCHTSAKYQNAKWQTLWRSHTWGISSAQDGYVTLRKQQGWGRGVRMKGSGKEEREEFSREIYRGPAVSLEDKYKEPQKGPVWLQHR